MYKEPKHTESEGLPVVQPSTKVTPRVCLGVVYKALSAPFDPLTEAREQALGVGTHARDTTTISTFCYMGVFRTDGPYSTQISE